MLTNNIIPSAAPNAPLPHEQANFHTTLSGQSMVSLIYHKKLDDEWKQVG